MIQPVLSASLGSLWQAFIGGTEPLKGLLEIAPALLREPACLAAMSRNADALGKGLSRVRKSSQGLVPLEEGARRLQALALGIKVAGRDVSGAGREVLLKMRCESLNRVYPPLLGPAVRSVRDLLVLDEFGALGVVAQMARGGFILLEQGDLFGEVRDSLNLRMVLTAKILLHFKGKVLPDIAIWWGSRMTARIAFSEKAVCLSVQKEGYKISHEYPFRRYGESFREEAENIAREMTDTLWDYYRISIPLAFA